MKLYCFLITFVFVNALADDEAECKKAVFLTNAAFRSAYNLTVGDYSRENGLERVIHTVVNYILHSRRSFAKINFMIAVPDNLEIINDIPEYENLSPMKKCRNIQSDIKKLVVETLNLDYPETVEGQDFGAVKLATLGNERREYVVQALRNMFKRELGPVYNDFMLELEPKIRDPMTDKVQDLGSINLTTLAENRRVHGTSLENKITRALERDIPKVAEVQYETDNSSKHGIPIFRFCRLMALYISTQFPKSYIKKIQVKPDDYTCTLWDGRTQKIYRKINGIWKLIR